MSALVIIDTDNADSLADLIVSLEKWGYSFTGTPEAFYKSRYTSCAQAALREYANPTPPKPDEPQGLGAVVEDADGDRWVRSRDQHKGLIGVIWENSRTLAHRSYTGIDAVRVLSEGVTP